MNVLLISPYFRPAVGGVETHLDDLCDYLTSKKHKVYVRTYKALGTSPRGLTNESSGYLNIHRMSWPDFGLVHKLESFVIPRILYIATGLFIDNLLFLIRNNNKIDVIQIHGFIAAIYGVFLGKIFGKRTVVNTHVGFKFERNSVYSKAVTFILGKSDEVLVLTKGAKNALVQLGISKSKITIYHYWVDQETFAPVSDARKKLGWHEDDKVTLFVGRLVPVKGINTVIKLAEELRDIKFKIIGSGPLAGNINKESEKLDNLEFIGKIDNKKLPVYYSGADLLLAPSKIIKQTYEEGIPRVLIEALSSGLPIVTTPSGGIPDVFSEKVGLMLRDDYKVIKKGVKELLSADKRLRSMQKQARKFALKHFSQKNAEVIEKSLHP